jgi:hypothetical protein
VGAVTWDRDSRLTRLFPIEAGLLDVMSVFKVLQFVMILCSLQAWED